MLRIDTDYIEGLVRDGKKILQVPGKAVLTRKAGVGKRRFRCVACGNYVPQSAHDPDSLYASGVEGLTVRTAIALAALKSWSGLSADIRTAFLHAPLCDELDPKEVIIVKPPSLLVEMKLLSANDRWLVLKALYGLRQAPLAWARFRDRSLRDLAFECEGITYILVQGVSDDSLWFITKKDASAEVSDRWHGVLIIYVDDLLGFASTQILCALFAAIQRLWKLSDPQWVSKETTVTFCGIEIQAIEGGFKISQGSYLKELFSRYDIHSSASTPLSSWSEPEIESDATLETVREAQALTGALLWASTKSRPDIAFAVSKLGQYATKSPSIVIQRGRQVLQYLYGTADLWVEYKTSSGSWWLDSPMPRTLTTLELFTDASHAPDGGRSCQAIFICWCNMVLAWESSRQPFTTLSSAESELVAVTSGLVAAESVAAIVEELVSEDVIVSARCDNAAAVRAYAAGNLGWRNRHLRMRAAAGRERIQAGSLVVSFIPGESQVADLATKPLSRPRIMHLLGLLGLRLESKETEVESARAVSRLSTGGGGNLVKAEWLAGLALLAALPGVKAQPLELRFAVYDLFIWVVGVVITGVALLRAWLWLFGAITLFQFGSGLDLHQVQEESESTTEVSVGSVTYPNCAQEVHGGQGVSGLDRTSGGSSEDSNKSDSDVFDEEEWKRSQRALIDRELYTGLTFVQRAKLRQQLVKGDIVDAPNMMQRYGPAPSWYTGVDPDDPSLLTSTSASSAQIGGSSSSQEVPVPSVQIGGSSSSQEVPVPSVQVGGSSSNQEVSVPSVQIGGSSGSIDGPLVSDGVSFEVVFQFVQVGDRFEWVPVTAVASNLGASEGQGLAEGEAQLQTSVVQNREEPACYEDLFDEEEDQGFPIVGDLVRLHYLNKLLSFQGSRILAFLGHRAEEWMVLRRVSAHIRTSLVCSVVQIMRRTRWTLQFQGPQWFAATDEYIQGAELGEGGVTDDSDDSEIDQRPHNAPVQHGYGLPQWVQRIEAVDSDDESNGAASGSTTEPSVVSMSSSASGVSSEARACESSAEELARDPRDEPPRPKIVGIRIGFRVLLWLLGSLR